MAQKLQQQLREVGSKLESPPTSKDALIKLLKQAATYLAEVEQSPSASMIESIKPCLNAIAKPELLKHQDRDIKVLVATCICEITRITAPEAPYSDDVLRDIFNLIVGTFSGLGDIHSPSFGRRVVILETVARYRSCVVMLDLECNDLVNEMFSTFFAVVSDYHPESVLTSMQTIMVLLLEESEDVQENLLLTLLSVLGRGKSDVSAAARRLAMNVLGHCAGKLESCMKQFLISSMSGDKSSLNSQLDYHEVIYDIYQCAPQILGGIIPYITGELLTDQIDVRMKAVKLLGDLFALPNNTISEIFRPLFSEFLKRLTDRVVEVRISVIEDVKKCLLSNPSRSEAPEIINALSDRLLDYDENVRKQVVAAVFDIACQTLKSVPADIVRLAAERLRDKSLIVKSYTMERLAELYWLYCSKYSDGSISSAEFEWIPGRILRCLYDKDFRSETIEAVLCGSLSPTEFSVKDKVKLWVTVLCVFEKVDTKALEKLLVQKQRLQQEMQKYLSLRQANQDGDAPELQKRFFVCFRTMSRLFTDPAKAEENFRVLNQLKDANVWKILTNLLDPNTSLLQAYTLRDDLLKILGEKHPLYDFLDSLSIKCSYLLFNKEYVKEILLEVAAQKSTGDTKLIVSWMTLLVILGTFSPLFLAGAEEDLVLLLKEDNEIIKEGIVHALARAGGTIKDQLSKTSSSVELLLETLCLEGNRKQAKYAVQALAAITKDEGLKSLSVLYKRLVDILEKRTHLPAVLQSLGCIAQTAMPVFETREGEVVEFIMSNILKSSNEAEENTKTCWEEQSELCLLKIYGIKALVKSYLPVKDAHLRMGIENLLGILKNILFLGEISEDIKSSPVDKAHLKLASAKAVLRLSKYWDHKIPVDVFHLILKIPQDTYPQARKLFLSKVHQYIKERLLDAKYACALLFNVTGSHQPEFKENKHNLVEVVQMCQQVKARQLSMQRDANSSMAYPEFILAYLVHALAHHSCPDINECKEVQAFEQIYRQVHLFLAVLLNGYGDGQSGVVSAKGKESVCTTISILQSIKCSEDVVDQMKSKHSHAISELGLSITKRFVNNQGDLTGITSVPLPAALYKPVENNDNLEVGADMSWLVGDSAMAHFESLKFENKEVTDIAKDENALENSDRGEAEIPLGKMMKHLKSQRSKRKKVVKNHTVLAEENNSEKDIDILGVVREINIDNMERAADMEFGKLINDDEHYVSGRKEVSISRKRRKSNDPLSTPVLEKKRLPLGMDIPTFPYLKKSAKGRRKGSGASSRKMKTPSLQSVVMDVEPIAYSEAKLSNEKDMLTSMESDNLASSTPKNKSFSSRHKKKGSVHNSNDLLQEALNHDLTKSSALGEKDDKNSGFNSKSSIGSSRKRKRRSIAGLAKCSTEKAEELNTELIGCRVKVWWPMDKQYYEGMVQSYDPGKKKHVILYEDGDVEVLNLDKEKWEVVSDDHKPQKLLKSALVSASKGLSSKQKKGRGPQGTLGQNKTPNEKYRRKTTKKSTENDQSEKSDNNITADFSDVENNHTSDTSSALPPADPEVEDIKFDGSEGEKTSFPEEMENLENDSAGQRELEISDPSDTGIQDSEDEPLSMWKLRAAKRP
eukprot:TRINITY_DN6598_c0_g1_i2.p1 TRINITY_DN6598_c0_g1~~TRINITY_DN6598_c0_g1_i2.p1  ORF type:complete len:1598 (+),score=356.34 TRINITY_DN6598_c0_g1_i2:124-4917(+)